MSNTSTNMITAGSAQVVSLELKRSSSKQPLVGSATILYRQFGWSTPREFQLEILSVEAETLLRESLYRECEFRLDVFKPDFKVNIVDRIFAKLRLFFGTIRSQDVASMSMGLTYPAIGLPE